MPRPLGNVVIYVPCPGARPELALVARVDPRALELLVFVPGSKTVMPRRGVRHRDDPEISKLAEYRDGTWSDTERDAEVEGRLAALADVERRVGEMEKALAALTKK
jgi:hypothetical protein